MSTHRFRDRERAVRVVAGFVDAEIAGQIVDALATEGIELPHPMRELIRELMPNGSAGFVCEDIDWPLLVIRTHGRNFRTDELGQLRLVELKHGEHTKLGRSKEMTFGLLDTLCRRGDGTWGRYHGRATINFETYPRGHPSAGEVRRQWINGREVSREQLRAWLALDEDAFESGWGWYRR